MKIPMNKKNRKIVCKDCLWIASCDPFKSFEFNFYKLKPSCWRESIKFVRHKGIRYTSYSTPKYIKNKGKK